MVVARQREIKPIQPCLSPGAETLGGLLTHARSQLETGLGLGAKEAHLEAQILLAHVLERPRAYLLAHSSQALTATQGRDFHGLLGCRLQGEPIAYLVGQREFFGLDFKVSPAVLIPRPETEVLVEWALALMPADKPCRVLELGTGSGAIALTLGKLRACANIVAIDVSLPAIELAKENARSLQVKNVVFIESDWFSNLAGERYDFILSNPPYVAQNDAHLDQGDVRFEPRRALVADDRQGLDCIRCIAQAAHNHLNHKGWLMVEHGYDQGGACRTLFNQCAFEDVQTLQDLAGLERVTGGYTCTAR